MTRRVDRRRLLGGAASAALAGAMMPTRAAVAADTVALGEAKPFSFEGLKSQAAANARRDWQPATTPNPEILNRIDYDAYQAIRFRRDMTLQLAPDGRTPVQLFHLGQSFREPVSIWIVEQGEAREFRYRSALFDSPPDHPARQLPDGIGFAGYRVMAPDLLTDWLSFLGASYFRASGPYNQYGLSARGLAIDTALPRAEEFPRFSAFWLERGGRDAAPCVSYALLESASVTGAYRFSCERVTDSRQIHRVTMDIEAELFTRKDIDRLGIAPFSSMFWYGEGSRKQASDWRPEIHDSDGLAIRTGSGERIWRPINNPPRVMTSTFVDNDVKGFGLLQRDRDFVHYLDDGVFYERRPSVWVEPLDGWGEGAVHLVEIPTDDEIHDNVVAYWCPKEPFKAGQRRTYRYRLSWLDNIDFPSDLARATATLTGSGGRPGWKRPAGVRKFVIDFQGAAFQGLGRDDGVEIVVTTSRGAVSNAYTHPVVDQRERWRALFDLEARGSDPVDLRAYLRRNQTALTETWVYQYFPSN